MRALDGKVVWITGAGTGIGEASARMLALAGMTVVLSGRRADPLEQTAASIRETGGQAEVIALDVADRAAVFDAAATIDRIHGRIDMLFANAGTNLTPRNWSDAVDDPSVLDGWDTVIDANLKGVYNGVTAVLPAMRRQADGLIVITSSWAGRFYSKVAGVAYGASKHAVMSLSAQVNMQEGANGIRSCAICPGEVATPILDRRPVKLTAQELEQVIQPADIAEAALFVARMSAGTSVHEILIAPTRMRAALG
ncbi:short-chain dehydrogenase/reductase SDR [alpha proteobacterium BAL199]|jgi:NADP-dependent 3-hydroxy acid dehydrogenase YdfG|nr:short-chain dehydrogenase/reductase SDR [alpha proteobacterium BAL199]